MSAPAPAGDSARFGKLDSILTRVLGYLPSDSARVELYKWVDAFRIHENDAMLMVLAFTERHRWSLDKTPDKLTAAAEQLEAVGDRAIARVERSVGGIADKAVDEAIKKKVEPGLARALAAALAEAAKSVSKTQGQVSHAVLAIWAASALGVLGGLFMVCGWELARGKLPFWMSQSVAESGGGLARVAGAILGAPAGYWIFVCLGVGLSLAIKARWARMKMMVKLEPGERQRQYLVMAGLVGGWVAFGICLVMLLGSPLR